MTFTEHVHDASRVTIEITASTAYAVERAIAQLCAQYPHATFIEPVQLDDGQWHARGHRDA